ALSRGLLTACRISGCLANPQESHPLHTTSNASKSLLTFLKSVCRQTDFILLNTIISFQKNHPKSFLLGWLPLKLN
ncbi:hypothetical protein, partial [Niallia circulans]|uniref:hypothetical protein n=1 Tax=Niallia circulans TaxID=1397 RepID=UPI001C274F8E